MEKLLQKISGRDQKIAQDAFESLQKYLSQLSDHAEGGISLKVEGLEESITIPTKAFSLLAIILSNMSDGKSITIIPNDTELSTQQAAEMLNVSRPHLVKLLENQEIPFKKVGSHRRVRLKDLMVYVERLEKIREEQLGFLAEQAQTLKLGYE